jgi:hypothetical protein
MAGATVIASVAKALGPIVFGGDGASFAVSVADAAQAQLAQSETATGSLTIWVRVCGLVYPA